MTTQRSERDVTLDRVIRPYRKAAYQIDIPFNYVAKQLDTWKTHYSLNLDPDYQRGHVWTPEQRIQYIEYILRGGQSAREIQFNHPEWNERQETDLPDEVQIVDGKQRLESVLRFMRGEILPFHLSLDDLKETAYCMTRATFLLQFRVHNMATREDLLNHYIAFNGSGTPHSLEELDRVRALRYAPKAILATPLNSPASNPLPQALRRRPS